MKKILFFLFSILLFTSCGVDRYKSRQIVENTFKDAEIYDISDFTYLVIDSVGIHVVKCLNLTNNDITSINTYKRWRKQLEE